VALLGKFGSKGDAKMPKGMRYSDEFEGKIIGGFMYAHKSAKPLLLEKGAVRRIRTDLRLLRNAGTYAERS
jgi:hypothetical protein